MVRRVGAQASAGRAAMGEDLGLFRVPGKVSGTAPQSASNASNPRWSNGRTPTLTSRKSGSESRSGNREPQWGGRCANSAAPDHKPGGKPVPMTATHNIARRATPFKSGIWPHEHPAS